MELCKRARNRDQQSYLGKGAQKRKFLPSMQKSRLDSSLDVQGMEDVRSQLKNMLKLSTSESNSMMGAKSFDFNDDHEEVHNEPYQGNVEYSLMSGNGQDNVSELLENFPSITACMWTDNSSINRNDVSIITKHKDRIYRKWLENSPQQSIPTFGGDRRSPKYSPSHGQSPHHHSIVQVYSIHSCLKREKYLQLPPTTKSVWS
ncbi:unnamed protein product [Mytilus edulis]|uniref:Uncharacterized protein n=1 Tax=Mytilus edulis TaxID=6550 RepID=A0A8S3PQW8_MYTED|nr:unnamed protein product [Mytilus edulis]